MVIMDQWRRIAMKTLGANAGSSRFSSSSKTAMRNGKISGAISDMLAPL